MAKFVCGNSLRLAQGTRLDPVIVEPGGHAREVSEEVVVSRSATGEVLSHWLATTAAVAPGTAGEITATNTDMTTATVVIT